MNRLTEAYGGGGVPGPFLESFDSLELSMKEGSGGPLMTKKGE